MVARSQSRRSGFTLLEMLLCLVVVIPLVYGAALLALAVVRASSDERVSVTFTLPADATATKKSVYRGATRGVESDAVIFHAALSQLVARATATYVFGAENVGVPPASRTSLSMGPLTTASWIGFETSNSQRTPREFLADYGTLLGGAGAYVSPDNFSLVVVGPMMSGPRKGHIAVTGIAQVNTLPASISSKGENVFGGTLLWARLWTQEGYFEYAWVLSGQVANTQAWKPKASQFWLRVDDTRRIYETGPALCWFPDPIPAGETAAGISRFSYVF